MMTWRHAEGMKLLSAVYSQHSFCLGIRSSFQRFWCPNRLIFSIRNTLAAAQSTLWAVHAGPMAPSLTASSHWSSTGSRNPFPALPAAQTICTARCQPPARAGSHSQLRSSRIHSKGQQALQGSPAGGSRRRSGSQRGSLYIRRGCRSLCPPPSPAHTPRALTHAPAMCRVVT